MSKITLNFFGESISIPKPKDLQTLRQIISLKFYINSKDAEQILLTYTKNEKKFTIYSDDEFKEFLTSNVDSINLDVDEKSQIHYRNIGNFNRSCNMRTFRPSETGKLCH